MPTLPIWVPVINAIDRLISLFKIREKRFRFRFGDIYKPSFTDAEKVHGDYLEMFAAVAKTLDTDKRGDAIKKASELLAQRRLKLRAVRTKLAHFVEVLREDSQTYRSLRDSEKKFLRALVAYLTAPGATPSSIFLQDLD
jgi:hypothetical protein